MLAEVSNGDIWAALITVAASILLGGLGMAWRLGALSQKVSDFTRRLERVEHKIDGSSTWPTRIPRGGRSTKP